MENHKTQHLKSMKTTQFHTNMKKRITITIDQEDFDWIEKECLKISPLIAALIKRHISMKTTQFHTPLIVETDKPIPKEILKELEVFNEGTA
jgi:hypothetical protein